MTRIRKPLQATPIEAFLMCNTHRPLGTRKRLTRHRRSYNKNFLRLIYCVPASVIVLWFTVRSILSTPGCNIRSDAFWRASHRTNAEIRSLQRRFPVHVGDDMETILHPGFLFSDQERLKALFDTIDIDMTKEMEVPKFWNPPEYGSDGVRGFLGNDGDYLIRPSEAAAIGSKFDGRETIFVALASYRDPECLATLEDIFDRATYPERIRVAIVDQRSSGDPRCTEPVDPCEQNPGQTLCKYVHLIDSKEFDPSYMVGPTFARHLAYRMYRGEFFALQVDSHVRFVAGWDEDLIDQWQSIGSEMAVISTYLSDVYNSIDPETYQSTREKRSIMCNAKYDWKGSSSEHIRYAVQTPNKPTYDASPMLEPFWAAGFSFARGHFLVQVPYDQYLPMVFQGEEISMTVRGFTYGYDFYAPSRNVAFHIYATHVNMDKREEVKSFTENNVLYPSAREEGYRRLSGIIGSGKAIEYNHIEEKRYGLGRVRSRELFYRTFGIYTKKSEMEHDLCRFVQGFGKDSMHKRFSPFLRYDGMGIDYNKLNFEYRYEEEPKEFIEPEEYESLRKQLQAAIGNKTVQ